MEEAIRIQLKIDCRNLFNVTANIASQNMFLLLSWKNKATNILRILVHKTLVSHIVSLSMKQDLGRSRGVEVGWIKKS